MPPETVYQLDQAVAEVFAIMLNLVCTPAPGTPALSPGPCLTASVQFSGSMVGACTVSLAPTLAAELTAELIGLPCAEISPTLCADTAGELCNMIAGAWKTSQFPLQDDCHLSCPLYPASPSAGSDTTCRRYRFPRNGEVTVTLTLSLS